MKWMKHSPPYPRYIMDPRIIFALLFGALLAPIAWPIFKVLIGIIGLGTLIFLYLSWDKDNDWTNDHRNTPWYLIHLRHPSIQSPSTWMEKMDWSRITRCSHRYHHPRTYKLRSRSHNLHRNNNQSHSQIYSLETIQITSRLSEMRVSTLKNNKIPGCTEGRHLFAWTRQNTIWIQELSWIQKYNLTEHDKLG